jgi:hypothetical protein
MTWALAWNLLEIGSGAVLALLAYVLWRLLVDKSGPPEGGPDDSP